MRSKFLCVVVLLVFSVQMWGHGEDKPGPHGGEVRMPGAFHTEVVVVDKRTLKIYLTDLKFKNPTVVDSGVDVVYSSTGKFNGECTKENDAFVCLFANDVDLKTKGTLEVSAIYKKQKGNRATYSTPIKFSKL